MEHTAASVERAGEQETKRPGIFPLVTNDLRKADLGDGGWGWAPWWGAVGGGGAAKLELEPKDWPRWVPEGGGW